MQTSANKSPAEIRGMASGTFLNSHGVKQYQMNSRSFEGGQNPLAIALDMLSDHIDYIWDFYTGEANWSINGICKKKTFFYPYQKYDYHMIGGEFTSDIGRGQFLDNLIVWPLFKSILENGPLLPIVSTSGITPVVGGVYDFADEMAPIEINRARAASEPKTDGTQKSPLQRAAAMALALGTQGSIPNTPGESSGFHDHPQALKRGAMGKGFRNIEFHRYSGLESLTRFPQAFLGNCHHFMVSELIPPFIHRSDNPLYWHFTRNRTIMDMLYLLKGKANKVALSYTPDVCVAHELAGSRGLPAAMGVWHLDQKFGTLSSVNTTMVGAVALPGANQDNCLTGAGNIYPLNNRIQGGFSFAAAAHNRFIRANRLTQITSFGLFQALFVGLKGVIRDTKVRLRS